MDSQRDITGRLVYRLAARDPDGLAAVLAPDVRLRALLPRRSLDLTGRDPVAAEMVGWFAEVPAVEVLDSGYADVGGLAYVWFRFGLPGQLVEQQLYCTVEDGTVTAIRLVCSGFRPVAARELDALGQGCATLTPLIAAGLRDLAAGEVLAVLTDDPAAPDGIAAWSRLTGHALVATVPAAGGTRYYLKRSS